VLAESVLAESVLAESVLAESVLAESVLAAEHLFQPSAAVTGFIRLCIWLICKFR
jgi:hypothetical protein